MTYVCLLKSVIIFSALLFLMLFWYVSSRESARFLGLPEGSACVTHNVTGTCAKMHTCITLIFDIMMPTGEKLYPEICSYDGDTPIVCCTSCVIDQYKNISNAVVTSTGLLFWKTGRKVWDQCLEYAKVASKWPRCWKEGWIQKKWDDDLQCHDLELHYWMAAGGMNAERDEFTHMALLGYGSHLRRAQWMCGGSLISEKFILTAGHCIAAPSLGRVRFAALGILKRNDSEDLWQRYRIQRIIPHPEYRPPSKYHDIALLETYKPVAFNKAVYPACLPMFGDKDLEDYFAQITAIGWGALGPNEKDMANTLQVIRLRLFFKSTCSDHYPAHRLLKQGYNHTTQMCLGDEDWNAADTCQGDSGGPLQLGSSSLCMYFVHGVTSFGRSCGFPGQSGIYVRVSHYVPWIESEVWPDS